MAVLLFVLVLCGSCAQADMYGPRDAWVLAQAPVQFTLVRTPEGQIRVMIHWHTIWSDGALSPLGSALYAKANGAEALFVSDHAHNLGDNKTTLDLYAKISSIWRVEVEKPAVSGKGYYNDVLSASSSLPTAPWLEVGEESHFLVCPGYGSSGLEIIDQIVELGKQTKTLGTQEVIKRIDQLLRVTGGFMIAAHPCNVSYPFNYNFDGCHSAVGVEFFNGSRAEHWRNFEKMIDLQKCSARPLIAVGGVDMHFPGDGATELVGVANEVWAKSFNPSIQDVDHYAPTKRYTYVWEGAKDAASLAFAIRDANCYTAYGDTVIVHSSARGGDTYTGQDVFTLTAKNIPAWAGDTLKTVFVDDESGEVFRREVSWQGTGSEKTASFSVNQLRQRASRSGKLIIADETFVCSAISVPGDQTLAKSNQSYDLPIPGELPKVPDTPAPVKAPEPTLVYKQEVGGPREQFEDYKKSWEAQHYTIWAGITEDLRCHVRFTNTSGEKIAEAVVSLTQRTDSFRSLEYRGPCPFPAGTVFRAGNRCVTTTQATTMLLRVSRLDIAPVNGFILLEKVETLENGYSGSSQKSFYFGSGTL